MTLMSVAERRTPCSDGPLYGVGSAVAGGCVAPRRNEDGRSLNSRCTFAILACSRIPSFGRARSRFFLARVVNVRRGATDPLYGVCDVIAGGAVAPRRHKRASRGWRNRPTQMDY